MVYPKKKLNYEEVWSYLRELHQKEVSKMTTNNTKGSLNNEG